MTFEKVLAETLRSIDAILADKGEPAEASSPSITSKLPPEHLEKVRLILRHNLQAREIEFYQPPQDELQFGRDTFYKCWLPAPDLYSLVYGCECEEMRRNSMLYAYMPRDGSERIGRSRNGRVDLNILLNKSLRISSVALAFYPKPQLPKREGHDLYGGVYLSRSKSRYNLPINQSEHGHIIADIGEGDFTFYQAYPQTDVKQREVKPGDEPPTQRYYNVPFSGKLYIVDNTRIHYVKMKKVINTSVFDLLDQGILTAFFKHIGYEQLDALALVHSSEKK